MQPGGINLSLKKRLGVSIWWQGRGGLTLRKLKNHIRLLMRLEDTPDYVVIHIWGNDRLEDTPDYILIHIGGDDRLEDTLDYILIHIWGNDRLEDTPDYVVIHIRGNDIGDIRVGHLHYLLVRFMSWFTLHYLLVRFMSWLTLHYLLVRSMSWLTQMMPQTGLIWSAILPRLTWKYSENNDRMEKCRRRLNSYMGLHMVRHGVII